MGKVPLPTCAQNRISVSGFAELKLDEATQDRLAFVCTCRMAVTARGSDDREQKEPA